MLSLDLEGEKHYNNFQQYTNISHPVGMIVGKRNDMAKTVALFLMFFALSSELFAYKEIVEDLSEQRAYAIEDGMILFDGPIS